MDTFDFAVEEFIIRNGIDDSAASELRECTPDVKEKVMEQQDLTTARNPSALLLARIRQAKGAGPKGELPGGNALSGASVMAEAFNFLGFPSEEGELGGSASSSFGGSASSTGTRTISLQVKFAGVGAVPSEALYLTGLPSNTAESTLNNIFATVGFTVQRSKVLPDGMGKGTCSALVTVRSIDEAHAAIAAFDGQVVTGPAQSSQEAASAMGFLPGQSSQAPAPRSERQRYLGVKFAGPNQEPNETLYLSGLPPNIDEQTLNGMFIASGFTVQRAKILPDTKGIGSSSAMVTVGSVDEANAVIAAFNGQTMGGPASMGFQYAQPSQPMMGAPPPTQSGRPRYLGVKFAGQSQEPTEVLYLTGLPTNADQDSLTGMFTDAGFTVQRCKILEGKQGIGSLSAMVTVGSIDEANAAIASFHGQIVNEPPPQKQMDVETFITQNNLDDKAATSLRDCPPEVAFVVMSQGGFGADFDGNPSAIVKSRVWKTWEKWERGELGPVQMGTMGQAGSGMMGTGMGVAGNAVLDLLKGSMQQASDSGGNALAGLLMGIGNIVAGAVQQGAAGMNGGSINGCGMNGGIMSDGGKGGAGMIGGGMCGGAKSSGGKSGGGKSNDRDIGHMVRDPAEITDEDIENFIQGGNLDSLAVSEFRKCEHDLQRFVVAYGELSHVRNPSGTLMSRIAKIRRDGLHASIPEPFQVEQWLLESGALEVAQDEFRKQTPELQGRVMARGEIHTANNPTAVLLSRIKKVKGEMQAAQNQTSMGGFGKGGDRIVTDQDVENFVQESNLDERAITVFRDLPYDVQVQLVKKGDLKNTRNPSATLLSRIKQLQMETGFITIPDEWQAEQFLQQSGADEAAQNMFRNLPPAVQGKVMERGRLDDTSNPSAVLLGRIKKVTGMTGMRQPLAQTMRSSAGKGGGEQNLHTVETFLAQAGVDDSVAKVLLECPPEVQQAVMARGDLSTARNPAAVLLTRVKEEHTKMMGGMQQYSQDDMTFPGRAPQTDGGSEDSTGAKRPRLWG